MINPKRAKIIQRIRRHCLAFGVDLDILTDDDICEGITRFNKILSNIGVSAKDASQALSDFFSSRPKIIPPGTPIFFDAESDLYFHKSTRFEKVSQNCDGTITIRQITESEELEQAE